MPILRGTAKKKGYYVVIFGSGRLGSRIANWLSGTGNSVVVVDRDEVAFQSLLYEFTGFTITGDATELETFYSAKVDMADFVLVLTSDDNTNVMIGMVAKEYFSVPRVLARVTDPNNIELFSEFGIEIICPTMLAVESIEEKLGFDVSDNK
ncbi:MAG: TrkA family potassium uptake protein [Kosmotogaceae bacterium]